MPNETELSAFWWLIALFALPLLLALIYRGRVYRHHAKPCVEAWLEAQGMETRGAHIRYLSGLPYVHETGAVVVIGRASRRADKQRCGFATEILPGGNTNGVIVRCDSVRFARLKRELALHATLDLLSLVTKLDADVPCD